MIILKQSIKARFYLFVCFLTFIPHTNTLKCFQETLIDGIRVNDVLFHSCHSTQVCHRFEAVFVASGILGNVTVMKCVDKNLCSFLTCDFIESLNAYVDFKIPEPFLMKKCLTACCQTNDCNKERIYEKTETSSAAFIQSIKTSVLFISILFAVGLQNLIK